MVVEIIGYVASFLVALSLVMVSIVKLRVVNLAGAVTFVIYGAFINSIPIVITNGFIVLVNVYYLQKLLRTNTHEFAYLPAGPEQRHRVHEFLDSYQDDVGRYYPLFNPSLLDQAFAGPGTIYLCVKNLKMVGLAAFIPVPEPNQVIKREHRDAMEYVHSELYPRQSVYMPVDYVTPKYRDIGLVKKLYQRVLNRLQGNTRFILAMAEPSNKASHRFLERNGYQRYKDFGSYAMYVRTVPTEG